MKVAIVGSGFGEYAVAPVYRKHGFDVEVVTPRDPKAVERVIASKVDLVSVHSPPFMHYDHVMMALEHARPVLCDKPFGLSGKQAREMRDRAREKGVLNFLNFEVRLKPSRAKLLELAASGVIGTPQHLSWSFFSNGFRGGKHGWINDHELGGGWINAYASHLIDFMRCLFQSDVKSCGGMVRTEDRLRPDREGKTHQATAEDAYSAWFVMRNGCTAAHDTAYAASALVTSRVAIMGTEGAIELVGDTRIIVRRALNVDGLSAAEKIRRGLHTAEGDQVFEIPPAPGEAHEPALMPWIAKIKASLESGKQITPSFDDGVAVAEAMDLLKANVVRV